MTFESSGSPVLQMETPPYITEIVTARLAELIGGEHTEGTVAASKLA